MTRSFRLAHRAVVRPGLPAFLASGVLALALPFATLHAAPAVLDPTLQVNTVTSGLNTPTAMAFIGANDFLVLEKNSGQVKRVVNGVVQATVLDLGVNSASERGLLGIALSPNFATDKQVYLYWTQSSTGADSGNLADTPLLGNRVDRFVLNGATLAFDRNIATLRALQADANQAPRGNNNGGALAFGPDGKLYVAVGDVGRRGWMQNQTPAVADDQFGGPEPDNAHLTGVVLRLNPDGTTPADNPFFAAGAALGGQAGANIQKVFSYGVRNSIGMDFDPVTGQLWMADNGDDAFDEINRVAAGSNGGWTDIMGPVDRVAEYKQIETTFGNGDLQQLRWPPSNIANTPGDALNQLFVLPGSTYNDPSFSWKYGVAPAGLGFLPGGGLGSGYQGDLFVAAACNGASNGNLYRFDLDGSRTALAFSDPDLADLVADNTGKCDGGESDSLLFGTGFGIASDIEAGLDGRLYIVSLTDGAVYSISAADEVEVPEPAGLGFAAAGLATLALLRRRRG